LGFGFFIDGTASHRKDINNDKSTPIHKVLPRLNGTKNKGHGMACKRSSSQAIEKGKRRPKNEAEQGQK
jgi:hypothetical protein